MSAQSAPEKFDIAHLIRMERLAFAAKVRLARAVIGLSQSEFAALIGMTQRSIHMLEQGSTEPRRTTVVAVELLWREHGISFEDLPGGGFRVDVGSTAFEQPAPARGRPVERPSARRMKLWSASRNA